MFQKGLEMFCFPVVKSSLRFPNVKIVAVLATREFKIATTTTATATSLNKRFNELMRRTMVLHVLYNSSYISLPSSAKQQLEMTNSALSEERELRRLIF